ncbi:hypothetical protein [Tamlana crocina]|uniref:Uncharacterized protein n=1 Tax=Tamlana crocina TaxID=393006 RepID=A0ABX1DCA7_9FLAO|nr:hypothetical protein [Tamlana crocina]NJX14233.1 hypothetical protein [Tamlana crocina]
MSLFLLADEYFKLLDKVEKSKRRIILLCSLVLLSIVSIIDVITEVNDGKELVDKANKIIGQSDTLISQTNSIIVDLSKNIESVQQSNKSIVAIDSVLKGVRDTVSNQVEIIKSTAKKSAELIRLEEKKFMADQADIDVFTNEVRLINNSVDSTFFDIQFDFRNLGMRTATNIEFKGKVLLYNKILQDFQIQDFKGWYFSENLTSRTKGTIGKKLKWKKEEIITGNYYMIFIVKSFYQDLISKRKLSYTGHFLATDLKNEETKFNLTIDYEYAKGLNERLREKGLKEYSIDLNKD